MKTITKIYTSIVSAVSLLVSPSVLAEFSQWSTGIVAAYSPAVYKDTPSNRVVVPMIGYEGEHVFLRGVSAGYRLNPIRSKQNVLFRLIYDPRTLQPQDSRNEQIRLLDKRSAAVLGGVSYQLATPAGLLETSAGVDITNTHNGMYAEMAFRLPIRFKGWGVTPGVGYSYNSAKLNNHLYGVSQAEAARSGLSEFEADWAGQYFVGASAYWSVIDNVLLVGTVRYSNLSGALKASPVIGDSAATTAAIAITYVF